MRPDRPETAPPEADADVVEGLKRYLALFEFAPDPYLVTDGTAVIEEANAAAVALFGRRKEFLVGKPLPFLVARADRRGFYERLAQLSRAGGAGLGEWEARLHSSNAEPVVVGVNVSVDAPSLEPGRRPRLRWLLRDVTARRRAEDALRAQKELAESLIDAAEVFVVLLDAAGRVTRVNAFLEGASGRGRADLVGRPFGDLLAAGAAGADEAVRAAAAGGTARGDWPLRTAGGGRCPVAWTTLRLPGPTGAVLAVGHDATELHVAQARALQMARLAAVGETAAGLAHESRNALQRADACLAMLRWALRGQDEALGLLGRLQTAHTDLLTLYESVRDFAAPVRPRHEVCQISDVWRRAWSEVTEARPGVTARLEEEADASPDCEADAFLLRQVFRNLFDNALAAGADRIAVRLTEAEADAVRVAVSDDGPGLPAGQKARLFEPFFTTKARGTGLGLAIVRRLVEAHGGRVAAGDAPGGGAAFSFTLPRRRT